MPSRDLDRILQARRDDDLAGLVRFLEIPSVSTDPAHEDDIRAGADFLVEELRDLGFAADAHPTARHPVVVARRDVDPSLPTVLVYGHYDVQPPDPLELWNSPPFEPTIVDGAVVARGACDDKGQVYAHVRGAGALLERDGELPVNLIFLVEGEEEIGSPNLGAFVAEHADDLACDVVVISDGAMAGPGVPTITYGLKGLAYLEVRVRSAGRDLHSGSYGGGVPNAVGALVDMLATLKGDDGRIRVPGFYDAVRDIDEHERETMARAPFDAEAFKASIGVRATPGEAGYSLIERLWARPTLDVNGIGGGFQGEGSKTVIPGEAMAKVSCRLVPDQDPVDITAKVGAHLRAVAPEGVEVEVIDLHGGHPAITPLDAPETRLAAAALERAHGREVTFVRTGGTIPVVSDFQRKLGVGVVLVGMGLESDRIHAPNEKFDLKNFYDGIRTSAALLESFAGLGRG